ncbi:NAD(P)-binding protein [Polaromonas sp. P5_D5]
MGQGAALKRRDFLAASALPLLGCKEATYVDGGFVGANHERGHLLRPDETGRARAWPAPSVTRRTRVLIAGGGVAGLAAARALRLRGMQDFALLELENQAGGNSRAGLVNGVPCPLGAHYLPVPGDAARDVQDLLEELSLRQRVAGRWVYDERHLCHSPQERLFINSQWQEGLLPLQDVDAGVLAEYRRFAALVQQASSAAAFQIPVAGVPLAPQHRALDAVTFRAWLDQQQLTSTPLRWYLDYCCRDDYGAGLDTVSAWAGIHYFASRHGFQAPGDAASAEREAGVLTWPEGNGWLTRQLAAPLGERLYAGRTVVRVAAGRHGVEVDAFNAATQVIERWQAEQCILAMPLFVAARVVESPPPALREAAGQLRYAPWLVANLHIQAALHDRPGAAPSWDNVIYGGDASDSAAQAGLGYVDAMHQSLQAVPDATVLTYYRAFGIEPAGRKTLYEKPWTHWRDSVLAELSVPHPDLPGKVTRMEVMRYGHAMSTPVPGVRNSAALRVLQGRLQAPWQRLHFAHSDLSGYSVFEEAFTQGHHRGTSLA